QYHHGMALKEAGKLAEARTVFEQVSRQSADRPEAAEALLRWGQCLLEEARSRLAAGRKTADQAKTADESANAQKAMADAGRTLVDAAGCLDAEADGMKAKSPGSDVRTRILYEAAGAYRTLGEMETATARTKLAQEKGPAGQEMRVPLQPSEQKARERYQAL